MRKFIKTGVLFFLFVVSTNAFAGEKCIKNFYEELEGFIISSQHKDNYLKVKDHVSFTFKLTLNSEGEIISCDILQYDNAYFFFAADLITFIEGLTIPCLYSHFCSPFNPEFGRAIETIMPFKPSIHLKK